LRISVVQATHDQKLPVDSRRLARRMREESSSRLSPAPQGPLPFTTQQLADDAPYQHPCYAKGYMWTESLTGEGEAPVPTQFIGTGNFTACLGLAATLLPTEVSHIILFDTSYTLPCTLYSFEDDK
jgi:hypothetical protein